MSCVQLSGGGFPGGLPPWLVVPVIRSCQSPTWIWLVNHLHVHLHHDGCVILMANKKGDTRSSIKPNPNGNQLRI